MPSTSKAQQRLMGAALNCKRTGECSGGAAKVAKGMSEQQLVDFAKGPVVPNPHPMPRAHQRRFNRGLKGSR